MPYPIELTRADQWVCWQSVSDEPGKKPRKVPISPRSGKAARSNDPTTWSSFETAMDRLERRGYTGLGFMFTKECGFVGVDIDHCYDPHRKTFAPRRPPFSPGSRPLQLNFHKKKARLFRRLRWEWLALWED